MTGGRWSKAPVAVSVAVTSAQLFKRQESPDPTRRSRGNREPVGSAAGIFSAFMCYLCCRSGHRRFKCGVVWHGKAWLHPKGDPGFTPGL